MTSWQDKVPKQGTEPEEQLWSILGEMKSEGLIKKFDYNTDVYTPFRDYPIQADTIVEDVLIVEVQGEYWHSKKTRHKKDEHKLECFESLGYGCLWLYDDELNRATIPKYRAEWRPKVKAWITLMLGCSKQIHSAWAAYKNSVPAYPQVEYPHPVKVGEFLTVSLRGDDRR